jgi:hypothetical protein
MKAIEKVITTVNITGGGTSMDGVNAASMTNIVAIAIRAPALTKS